MNAQRPAGDYANRVTIHAGDLVEGVCTGKPLGMAKVDSGSGRWAFKGSVKAAPEKVCVASSSGGASSHVM